MADLVKRIVYPRDINGDTDSGWMFNTLTPPVGGAGELAICQIATFTLPKRPQLDVRIVSDPLDWISGFTEVPSYHPATNLQQAPGFVTPMRKPLETRYHSPSVDDLSWVFHVVPFTGFQPQLFPAIDFQSQSFRTKRFSYHKPGRAGTPRVKIDSTLVIAAAEQLLKSYLVEIKSRYLFTYHDWADSHAGIFATIPLPSEYSTEFWPAIIQLTSDRTLEPNSRRRGLENLWNSHYRSIAALFEDVEILAGVMAQQFDSFRMRSGKKMGLLETMHDQDGWIGFQEREIEVLEQVGVHRLLGLDYVMPRGKRYQPSSHDLMDWHGWLPEAATFDEERFNAIDFLTHAFRQGSRKPLDLHFLDTPLDTGWMNFTNLFEVPRWISGIQQSTESYRSEERKVTLDQLRVEDFHDFAWTRAVLDLVDAEFGQPRAHWRKIEGAIRNRRKRRRGR